MRRPNLLCEIERSRLEFNAGFAVRRFRLAQAMTLVRLAEWHQERRQRFERRYHRPLVAHAVPTSFDQQWDYSETGWRNLLMMDGLLPISNAANADIALRESPFLSGIVATDLTTGKIMLLGPPPFDFWECGFETRQLNEADVSSLHQYLQFLGLRTLCRDDAVGAIRRIARENGRRFS